MIKRRSAMSKRKPHDIKFKFKAIECAEKQRSGQHRPLFIRARVLVVLCSHLKFFSITKDVQTDLYMQCSLTMLSFSKVHNGLLVAISLLLFSVPMK